MSSPTAPVPFLAHRRRRAGCLPLASPTPGPSRRRLLVAHAGADGETDGKSNLRRLMQETTAMIDSLGTPGGPTEEDKDGLGSALECDESGACVPVWEDAAADQPEAAERPKGEPEYVCGPQVRSGGLAQLRARAYGAPPATAGGFSPLTSHAQHPR